jgi:hypothetical protein
LLGRLGFGLFGSSGHLAKGSRVNMSSLDIQLLSGHFLLRADSYRTAALKMNSHPSRNFSQLAIALITACVLAGCATYSKVSEKRPRYVPSTRPAGAEIG